MVAFQRVLRGSCPSLPPGYCRQCRNKRGPLEGFCSFKCKRSYSLDHNAALQRAWVFRRDEARCKWCGYVDEHWEMDHVLEVCRGGGGPFDPSNLQTLCRTCHAHKTAWLNSERAMMKRVGRGLVAIGGKHDDVG